MNDRIHDFIVGMAGGAVLASGFGYRVIVVSAIVIALINAYLATRHKRPAAKEE